MGSGFLDFAKITFNCPHCDTTHEDDKEFYLKRCNRNKSGTTSLKCSCGERFGMTYNIKGDAEGFKLENNKNKVL